VSDLEHPERPAGVPAPAAGDATAGTARPWAALWAIPIAFGALMLGGLAYVAADALRGALADPPMHRDGITGVALHGPPPFPTLMGTLFQDIALVAGAVLAAASALKGRITAAHFGLRRAPAGSSAAYVIGGYVLFLLVAAAWTTALGIKDHENIAIDLGTRDSAWAFAGAGLLVCVAAPICEELFFRGFLFGALRRRGLVLATLGSGLAFGVAHVASAPIGFIVPLAVLGVILALLYERTGSLYPSIGLHALNNSIAFGVGDGRAWAIPACLAAAGLAVWGLSRVARSPQEWRTVVPNP
jgi:membrane protease YdiL (CAAX protease family)